MMLVWFISYFLNIRTQRFLNSSIYLFFPWLHALKYHNGTLNSMDSKYILTGGEDDLVQVWSMEDRKVVAWGEGHNSWVSHSVILVGTLYFVNSTKFLSNAVTRLVEWLLIHIGHHQIQMKVGRLLCIGLVLLVRYSERRFHVSLCCFGF